MATKKKTKPAKRLDPIKRVFDVVTIGAATRDVFVKSSHFENVRSDSAPDGWNACLPLGAKITIDELVFETGGGATNAAVTFARFGSKTACVSRIGNDPGGCEIMSRLGKEKIDTVAIQLDPKERTAYSIILVAGTGNRAILVARGASSHLDAKAIPWPSLGTSWIYLTSVAGNEKLLKDVFAHAKRSLAHVAWNPGNAEIELGLKRLTPLLMQTDILFLNLEEAAALVDTSTRHLPLILKTLGSLPRKALVITDGKRGAYAHARGVTWHATSLASDRAGAAFRRKIVNTTGAGDAFGSGFTAALMQDGDAVRALQAGSLNAFGVISHMGAKAGILRHFPGSRDLAHVKVKELR
jgi:ribokinase